MTKRAFRLVVSVQHGTARIKNMCLPTCIRAISVEDKAACLGKPIGSCDTHVYLTMM